MKQNFKVILRMRSPWIGAAIFLLGIWVSSCKKPEDGLGLDLQPDDELLDLAIIDTTSLIMYTEEDDSLRTDELSNNIIGSYYDPEFGHVEASSYFQLRTDGEGVTFEEDSILFDSVFLALEYASLDGYYGNLDAQTFAVYEVTDTMNQDSAYYSNSFVNFDSTGAVSGGQGWGNLIEAGYETVVPDPVSEVIAGADTLDPQLRLKLNNAFGQYIINSSDADLLSNAQFVQYFKGIYVRTENPSQGPEEGALLYFNPEDAASKVTLYYREIIDGDTIPKTFDLEIDDNSSRFTKSSHDNTGSQAALAVSDSTLGVYSNYIQTLAGLRTVVNFPNIMDYADSGMIAINKAELVLPVEYFSGSNFYPNDVITALMFNEEGEVSFLPDLYTGMYGGSGTYDIENKEYRFVISGYIQGLLKGDITSNKLMIETNLSSVTGNRCILSGPETINRRKPQLILTYTNY